MRNHYPSGWTEMNYMQHLIGASVSSMRITGQDVRSEDKVSTKKYVSQRLQKHDGYRV
jgi:hypothetical protein